MLAKKTLFRVIILACFAVAGLLGLIFQLIFLNAGDGTWISPYVTGVWISSLMSFFAIHGLFSIRDDFVNSEHKIEMTNMLIRNSTFRFALYSSVSFFSALLSIGYFIGYRNDGGLWALSLTALQLFNAWSAFQSRVTFQGMKRITNVVDYESFTNNAVQNAVNAGDNQESEVTGDIIGMKATDLNSSSIDTPKSYLQRASSCSLVVFVSIAFLFNGLLLGGCWLQAAGYRNYPPVGTYVTIFYPTGQQQRILTACTGPRNSSVPTFWIESGGGGHSMSDLWGLRDYLNTNYNRRVCMYDMPGTAWSDPMIPNQPQITHQVIQAMGEPGPFLCIGSMDSGDERCYNYALQYPDNIKAVIPVSFSPYQEFTFYGNFYGLNSAEVTAVAKETLAQRLSAGNAVNFFGVSWGVIAGIATSPAYVPHNLEYESDFLNLYNEKQWSTNCYYLYKGVLNPSGSLSGTSQFVGETVWASNPNLNASIPVIGYAFYQSEEYLQNQCIAYGYPPSSKDCSYLYYIYNTTFEFNKQVIARNPLSRLVVCTNCSGYSFVMDQQDNIPWFAQTLMSNVGDITI